MGVKGRFPRFPHHAGFLPRRSKFLSGEWRAFFAPGQMPGMRSSGYIRPTDWTPSGYLLRAPQVVWLQARLWPAQTLNGDTLSVHYAVYHAVQPGSGETIEFWTYDTDPQIGWHRDSNETQTQENFARTETDRLLDVFSSVQGWLAEHRSGKTWAQVVDWYDGGAIEVDGWNDYRHNGCTFLEIPPVFDPSEPDFFGANFLNVYCGHAMVMTPDMAFASPVEEPWYDPESVPTDPLFSDPYDILKALQRPGEGKHPAFCGHSTRLFHPDLTWEHWHGSDRNGNSTLERVTGSVFWSDGSTTGLSETSSDVFDVASGVASMDGVDISHPGPTSLVTADYLVRLIAGHYGFDPETGADLR